ncbi:MAG UNVERIFIED_CONTAM: ribonuclease HI family protein [Microcystis novacekii LVE1205-3]
MTTTRYMERATNNEAEYTGLIIGLEKAQELGLKSLEIRGDSQLVINQVKGDWKVKSNSLRPFYQRACQLVAQFDRISWRWIERAKNSLADASANHCLDAAKNRQKNRRKAKLISIFCSKSLKPILNTEEFVSLPSQQQH